MIRCSRKTDVDECGIGEWPGTDRYASPFIPSLSFTFSGELPTGEVHGGGDTLCSIVHPNKPVDNTQSMVKPTTKRDYVGGSKTNNNRPC